VAIAKIRLFGDRCLRRRAQEAPAGAEETRALLETLWETLADDGGVGLAAPQIGVDRRVVVIRDPDRPEGQQRLDLVNPVVQRTFGSVAPFEEGCLSFPGLYTDVIRPQGVELVYETPDQTEPKRLRTDKVLARIILHEVDHLDGVLFVDHLSAVDRLLLGPRLLWITLRRLMGRLKL
jgi:peptide deformylase